MQRILGVVIRVATALIALVEFLLGFFILSLAWQVLQEWVSIGASFRAIGLIWLIAGFLIVISCVWAWVSLGRKLLPIWIASGLTVISGAAVVGGVLGKIIPCGGPS